MVIVGLQNCPCAEKAKHMMRFAEDLMTLKERHIVGIYIIIMVIIIIINIISIIIITIIIILIMEISWKVNGTCCWNIRKFSKRNYLNGIQQLMCC
jgi:hypothetical protein